MDPNSIYMVHEDKGLNREFVLNFLEDHYFLREPLLMRFMKMYQLIITTALRETMLLELRRRYEIIVRNCALTLVGMHAESGIQCGVGLARLEYRTDIGRVPEWEREPINTELLAVWCRCVYMVAERHKNFFDLFPDVNTIMRIVMIGVEEEHERNRMGTNMLREIVDRAPDYGAELVCGIFTSDHLKRVAIRYGFRSFGDLHLHDFRHPDGSLIYEGMEPLVVSCMAVRVVFKPF